MGSHIPRLKNWMGYRADLECQLKKPLTRSHSKQYLEMASQFVGNAIKDSYGMNFPIKLKNTSPMLPDQTDSYPSSAEARKLFNQTRNTSTLGVWEWFHETQRACKKVTVVAKRNTCKKFFDITEAVPEAWRLFRILSKGNNTPLHCLELLTGDCNESVEEFLGQLMEVHFPGSQGSFCNSGEKLKPRAQAIKSFEPYEVPGIDEINPIL